MLSWYTPEAEPLYLQIADRAAAALADGNPAAAARSAQDLADAACAALDGPDQNACGPGCGSCCVVNVDILAPEAAAIADFIKTTMSPQNLEILRLKIAKLQRLTRGFNHTERIISHQPCAFLDDAQSCSIHPVRPLLCRSVSSTSADDCRLALEMQEQGRQHPISCRIAQRDIYEAAFCGLAAGMERQGLDSRSGRLTDLIQPLLAPPP